MQDGMCVGRVPRAVRLVHTKRRTKTTQKRGFVLTELSKAKMLAAEQGAWECGTRQHPERGKGALTLAGGRETVRQTYGRQLDLVRVHGRAPGDLWGPPLPGLSGTRISVSQNKEAELHHRLPSRHSFNVATCYLFSNLMVFF